jgi:monoamine oxidase
LASGLNTHHDAAMNVEVIVVGGGMAGLYCADVLVRAGRQVAVLEATDRPGGRMMSAPAMLGGPVAEFGAEWIDTHHARMRGLVDRFSLTLAPPTTFNAVHQQIFSHGQRFDITPEIRNEVEQFWERLTQLGEHVPDPNDPCATEAARALDQRSLRDVFDEMAVSADADLLLTRLSQGLFGAEPRDVSVLYAVQQLMADLLSGSNDYGNRLDGGVSQIAEALAHSLGAVMHYEHRVSVVEWSDAGVTVRCDDQLFQAPRLVWATALGALRHMTFLPDLPEDVARAIAQINIGPIVKTPMVIEQWEDERWLTTDTAAQRWYRHNPHRHHDAHVVMTYTGGDDCLSRVGASSDEQVAWSAAQLTDAQPEVGCQVVGGSSHNWAADPAYGGAYSAYGPGQLTAHWATLRRPLGPIHFAGEYTSMFGGYMEGAAESGERAAYWALAAG